MTPKKRLEKIKKSISKIGGNELLIKDLLSYVEQKDREIKIFKPWTEMMERECLHESIWSSLSGTYIEGSA